MPCRTSWHSFKIRPKSLQYTITRISYIHQHKHHAAVPVLLPPTNTAAAGLLQHGTLHTLWRSYATHMLENGTDLRSTLEIPGHNSPKTTLLYTHVAARDIRKIKSQPEDLNI